MVDRRIKNSTYGNIDREYSYTLLIALVSIFKIELRAAAKREEVEEVAKVARRVNNTIKLGEILNTIAIVFKISYILSFYY